MGRRIVQDHKIEGVRLALEEELEMGLHLLMALALVNRVQPFPRGIAQTPQHGPPRVLQAGRPHVGLGAHRDITVADIRTPVERRRIKKHQIRWFRRGLLERRVEGILAAQGAGQRFFFNVSIRSRLTVYSGSGEVTVSLPRFQRKPRRLSCLEIADCVTVTP